MSDSIPTRIVQTGKSRELTGLAKVSACNMRLLHPDWDHRFFDDEEVERFITEEFPEYRAVYDGFPYKIQRFDFFRYLAVFRLGGFYFDLDILLSESLEELLAAGTVFPFEELTISRHLRQCGMDWEIGNYAFGARAGDPFLGMVIDNCVRAQRDPAWLAPMMEGIPRWFRSDFEVLNSTGPGLVSRTLAENPDLAGDVTVLFPDDVRDRAEWHQFGHFGVHLQEGTWRSRGGFLHRRLAWWWEGRVRRRLMGDSMRRGPKREVVARQGPADSGCP